MSPILQIFLTLLSAAATLISSMVLYNLQTLKQRMDRIEIEQDRLIARKEKCQVQFVDVEQWIRSETYTRRKLDTIAESVSALAANLKIVEQMPQICGGIARDIIREMKGVSK